MNGPCSYGFRIVGSTWEPRRLVDAGRAFAAYASCDDRAGVDKEAYLSAFQFGEDFRQLLTDTGSTAGFSGPCWSLWLWFDIDRDELTDALKDTRRLVANLDERYRLPDDSLLIFFSGSKGFHVGLPTTLWSPDPSDTFHLVAREFAEQAAGFAGVAVDVGVYDRVRAFRAPNSRHPKTGLHKRRLSLDELTGLSLDAILDLARKPEPLDVPEPPPGNDQAAADWQAASRQVEQQAEAKAARRAGGADGATLNRQTLTFIREGADTGDRHRMLFSAAANLAEFGCPSSLAIALLEESALDTGLPPKDVRRQVECGLASVGSESTPQDDLESSQPPEDGCPVGNPAECSTGDFTDSQGESCQQMTRVTTTELAALWNRSSPANMDDSTPTTAETKPTLPALPPRLIPLPPKAIGSGKLDTACRCGSTEYVDVAISGGRTRRDCRECGKFLDWGQWYESEAADE